MQLQMIDDRFPTMPWDLIDNVVFDVGNVLLSFQPDQILKDLLPECADRHAELKKVIFSSPYWPMQDLGVVSSAEAADLMSGTMPEMSEQIHRLMSRWSVMKHEIPEGIAAAQTCRNHGKKTYILSNYGDDAFASTEQHHAFFSQFDGKIISSRVKMMKPAAEIYRCLTDTFAIDPARTLFVDDAAVNIAGAIAFGWQGLWYSEPGKLTRFFGE